jgi:UDP-N-acetylglucosamine:LPS N-acetylglucosamine transferase
MGAGHNGAARELARRWTARSGELGASIESNTAHMVDFFDAAPALLGAMWQQSYRAQLRWAPGSYEASYRRQYEHRDQWQRLVRWQRRLTERTISRWVAHHQPDVIVSTYSFATQVMAEMRLSGDLDCPLVNVLTDFGVHPLLVHDGVDLHLAAHEVVRAQAQQFTDQPIALAGPAVRPQFHLDDAARAHLRALTRTTLSIADHEAMVLLLTGSWGVGSAIAHSVQAVVEQPGHRAVTVCGRDAALAHQLRAAGLGTVIGWTDDVAGLLAACDVVVENAGGLSAMESFAMGRPVITHRVIPGHGRDNAAAMAAAGVSTVTDDERSLSTAIDELSSPGLRRQQQIDVGLDLFRRDAIDVIAEELSLDLSRSLPRR